MPVKNVCCYLNFKTVTFASLYIYPGYWIKISTLLCVNVAKHRIRFSFVLLLHLHVLFVKSWFISIHFWMQKCFVYTTHNIGYTSFSTFLKLENPLSKSLLSYLERKFPYIEGQIKDVGTVENLHSLDGGGKPTKWEVSSGAVHLIDLSDTHTIL